LTWTGGPMRSSFYFSGFRDLREKAAFIIRPRFCASPQRRSDLTAF
jgi:hypothetical protein